MSADTELVRAYGAAASGHAADLHAAVDRLTALTAATSLFGPIGAPFQAALSRAADQEARTVDALRGALAAAGPAASSTAHAYERADADAGTGLLGP